MKRIQLFLIHFAGGNRYSFQFLRPYLPEVEFIPLELPGRGKRSDEALLTDFEKAASEVCRQILSGLQTEFTIYGHSLGAILALKAATMLESMGKFPQHIIVSGNAGPGVEDMRDRHLLNKADFKDELVRLGGVPQEFLDNDELYSFYEPMLRADFELAEKGKMSQFMVVDAPVYAIMGSEEDHMENIDNWRSFTRSPFRSEILPGDHFFIHRHPARMSQIIKYGCGINVPGVISSNKI